MTTNTTTTTTTRRVRRNRTIKSVLLVLMAIALVILAIFAFKGCNKDTTSDTTPGLIPTVGCTCTDGCNCSNNGTTNDYSALLVEIDLLKAERDALKAENESLKSGATADDKALADAKADAASWKSKYETLYKTHSSCTSVDLSKYVTADKYNSLVNEYNAMVVKYNDLSKTHSACGKNTVDLSQYVLKSDYAEVVNKYNKLVAEYNAFKANHTNCNGVTYVEGDHSNCVAKSTYQAALNELAQWKNHKCPEANHNGCVSQYEYNALNSKYQAALNELAQWKNHKCPEANHNGCVSQSEYNALNSKYQTALSRISDLEAELAALKAHQCDHSNCGNGTTIIQADHSNCVSLRDYNELLAAYNALLND